MKRFFRPLMLLAALTCLAAYGSAATTLLGGTLTFDSDLVTIMFTMTSAGTFSAQSMGYGGWTSYNVAPGGFATSLSLYELNDAFQFQQTHDYLGGTAVGAGCSNGGQQDSVT